MAEVWPRDGSAARQPPRRPGDFEEAAGACLSRGSEPSPGVPRATGGIAWQLAQARNGLFAYSTEQAALTVLFPAVAPELAGRADSPGGNGRLFVPVATPWEPRHPMATDEAFGAALWGFSECVVAGRAHDCSRNAT